VLLAGSLCFNVSSHDTNANSQVKENVNEVVACKFNGDESLFTTKATLVSSNFLFLEGPTWSKSTESFFFSEMNFGGSQATGPDATIYELTLPNTITTFMKHSGSNGLLATGNDLLVMSHKTRSVSRVNLTTKQQTLIVDGFEGSHFSSPNDVALHSSGHIYFTDPDWQLGDREKELPFTGIFGLSKNNQLTLIDKTRAKPNGIVLSPDESMLYVGDYNNEIGKYPVDRRGNVGKRNSFVQVQSPDGMTVDCAGNIYVASHNEGNIYVFSPSGKQLDKIYVTPKITNIDFGGPDMKTLLVTSGKGLYTLQTLINGHTIE
jgi:gluconolactonase